jgi:eukaryotic-like serine/threonine-protein kinase
MVDPAGDSQLALAASASTWTCPTCNNQYPSDFAVCPRDATPRTEQAVAVVDPLIGEVLGRTYRIVRVLGEGGMARLYEAEHLRIEARYAVKVIHDDLARDPDLLARFEREARAAARIRSEHVVRLVDVLRTQDNRPCLVTELLEGEDLQALLDRVKKLSVAQAIPIARQICRAMAAAHAVGVVHRDLKPSNVFLCRAPSRPDRRSQITGGGDPDPRGIDRMRSVTPRPEGDEPGGPLVKVFDFGVAKLEDDDKLTRTDAVMGTAAYMAPEQARRAADAGQLSDVYSASAVLYHMLTGEPPYGHVPAVSRLALVLHDEPARPRSLEPSIPDGVEAVIQHAMARDRASRIQSALELEGQLAAFDRSPRTTGTAISAIAAGPGPVAPHTTSDSLSHSLSQSLSDSIATQIVVRARIARPLAVVVAAASSLAAGAWIAALLAVIVQPSSGGERTLLGLFALAACAGVGLLHVRTLRPSWGSAPAVIRHIRPAARALVAGVLTFGALELIAGGTIAVFGAPALGPGGRVVLAGLAAALGLLWQRLRLDERLQRRIG